MKNIINRVKNSPLITFEISSLMPQEKLIGIDIKKYLWKELVLKEKEFRASIKNTPWDEYNGSAVYIYCSCEAIIPNWAYMLIIASLEQHTKKTILGSKDDLIKMLIKQNICFIEKTKYEEKKVLIKGCSNAFHSDFTIMELTKYLIPVVNSLMFGEACSNVPIYKKKIN